MGTNWIELADLFHFFCYALTDWVEPALKPYAAYVDSAHKAELQV